MAASAYHVILNGVENHIFRHNRIFRHYAKTTHVDKVVEL